VPLTIFQIEKHHQYGVVEMGTNAPGEIRRLSEISAPDIAVITNISKAHLEGLGNINGVAMAKSEILEYLNKDGTFIYNMDNPWCVTIADNFYGKKISFGFNPSSQICCRNVTKKNIGYSLLINENLETYLPVMGYHNIYNCLAAFAICHALGHDIYHLKDAFSSFKLPSMRIEREQIGKVTVINDAYNANPVSMRTALQYLSEYASAGRKVFICGDMLELGNESGQLHREIGETVAHLDIDLLWTVGKHASEIADAATSSGMPKSRVHSFKDAEEVSLREINQIEENDTILIKGSRGMHMERIAEKIRKIFLNRLSVNTCV
jgi:UDP-N-acetylmuramoyl-tripeptide--D-alanyl-D-alanine ligase